MIFLRSSLSTIFIIFFFLLSSAHAEEISLRKQAKYRWMQGDYEGVISLLEPWTKKKKTGPYGNERDALRILLASAYQERGDWALAAEQYSVVRKNNEHLSVYALFEEPKAYFESRNYLQAKTRCESVLSKYPSYEKSADCLIILGMSYGELGYLNSSKKYFDQYMQKYPSSPYQEVFLLKQADYTYRKSPRDGEPLLYNLYFNHSYPTTDLEIQAILGREFPITTLFERSSRIYSFIRGNRLKDAWELFTEIKDKEDKSEEEDLWVQDNIVNVSWRTRQFPTYIEEIKKQYEENSNSELAWKIFRAYCKAGLWTEASSWGTASIEKFGKTGRWSGSSDELARAHMFANKYEEAAEYWATLWGEDAKFYRAFCLYMAGKYEISITLFSSLISKSKNWDAAAAYWLGKAQKKLQQDPTISFNTAIEKDSSGWYNLLVEMQNENEPPSNLRKGVWFKPRRNKVTPSPTLEIKEQLALVLYSAQKDDSKIVWSQFQTPEPSIQPSNTAIPPSAPHRGVFPDGYANPIFGTQEELETFFEAFTKNYKKDFPYLPETELLISIGLYPEAARNMSVFAEQISNDKNQFSFEIRRALYLYSRNHHQTVRYTTNLEQYFDEEKEEIFNELKQINYPIVRPTNIWAYTEEYNVDPYLMLGLMRQESAYREGVRSWVGAIGYIQVMPATGAKVAYLLKDKDYTPKRLENPRENLKYGIFYFSKLMERFDNCFPLAVGSYNGGPHNMSRWYRGRMGTWELDEFIEHISYDETRQYIKKVTGHYAAYAKYYEGHSIKLPNAPLKDDPAVIDF